MSQLTTGTVTLGQLFNSVSAGNATTTTGGTVIFDTGTFTAANLIMGVTDATNTVCLDGIAGKFTYHDLTIDLAYRVV